MSAAESSRVELTALLSSVCVRVCERGECVSVCV